MSRRIRIEPLLRPLMQMWWRMTRSMTLGVRAIVENDAGEVLLVRHTYVDGWYLPGGGVERGETLIDALTKELAEEAGVAPIGAPDWVGMFSNDASFKGDHVAVYHVRNWQNCGGEKAGEIAETGWFDPLSPPEGTTPGTQRRLAEAFSGEPIGTTW